MKRKKENGPGRSTTKVRIRVQSQTWGLVLIDQTPLRRKAAADCRRAMSRLEKAKAEWKRFQQEDVAAYARWNAATFGPLLSRKRELEEAIDAKEMLILEVEDELHFRRARSLSEAYARVMRRRENPAAFAQTEANFDEPPPSKGARKTKAHAEEPPLSFDDLPDFFQEMLFAEALKKGGFNPDRMSQHQYDAMFEKFKTHMRDRGQPGAGEASPPPNSGHASEPEKSADARLKELYRLLVRRLHPDMRADGDAEVSAIWHEVQEAYRTGNVERLEMLLALSELEADAFGEGTSLSQMRSVLAELRRSYNALQRNLKAAKADPAWNFSQRPDRPMLARRMTSDLKRIIKDLEYHLESLEAQVAHWAKPPAKRRRKKSGKGQMDFFG